MTLGDSIGAALFSKGWGNGAPSLMENRGWSYASGGGPNVSSLVNFFKVFSPSVRGESNGNNIIRPCYGPLCLDPELTYKKDFGYNLALSGALVTNLAAEVEVLTDIVRTDPDVNLQNDWKFLTVLIGANDQCLSCANLLPTRKYEEEIRKTIETLRKNFPRTIVHFSTIFKVSGLYQYNRDREYCRKLRGFGGIVECPCAFAGGDTRIGGYMRSLMDKAADAWNGKLHRIAKDYSGKYEDFAVVVDPGSGGIPVDKFGQDYISSIDCFHPSSKAHAIFARASWNNLFLPAEQKARAFELDESMMLYCPTEEDRIQVH
ncbi:uncharacterized protein SPPG_07370 [Spizellomyces punctatus DAOM BR117]|uniref:SGNH hydrolase-type esterase domain-containing protein n=1 Tax=Spizellomyces punctatus (strain DAOM BR117) TaxID=645134 RepID=A0A0L0H933_SPIPD|nr:uncharacterized protein SPPG_07370 [Spizellomyces punctatus DAOM BR117]KNC97449.1 hypothetical protein SPPG_07370 [Spizellomyces punctatus DAOM BR117]|eukprot:XP_016605489.1 hypothetical protein SPPG_07370 [Spizellomyces punctatus DAOM BR117]